MGTISGSGLAGGFEPNGAGASAETKGKIGVEFDLSLRGLSQILGEWDRLSSLSAHAKCGKAVPQIEAGWEAIGAAETGDDILE
jgi:hypothetical protein